MAVKDSDAGPTLAQNLDIGSEDFYYIIKTSPEGANTVLSQAMCSMCWTSTGINNKGLAIGSSNLGSPARKARKPLKGGIGNHFIVKPTLQFCSTTSEAVEFIKSLPEMCPETSGYQMNIIDAKGNMAVVDKTGPHCVVRQCEEGMNFTTNYSLDEKLEAWRMEDADFDEKSRNSRMRAENIISWHKGLENKTPTVASVKKLFSGHNGQGRICRHGDKASCEGYSRLHFICYHKTQQIEATNGLPCENQYQKFEI